MPAEGSEDQPLDRRPRKQRVRKSRRQFSFQELDEEEEGDDVGALYLWPYICSAFSQWGCLTRSLSGSYNHFELAILKTTLIVP